jgi:single-strand DNA-binding protein
MYDLNLSTMIKLQVIGNLGKDCVVNTVNGKNVINFTVAHTEKYRTWVDCAYWTDKTAISPYLTKGKQVFVEGTPEARSFQRNDGTPGSSLSLRVREIQLLGGRGDSNAVSSSAPAMAAAPSADDMTDASDDLPF